MMDELLRLLRKTGKFCVAAGVFITLYGCTTVGSVDPKDPMLKAFRPNGSNELRKLATHMSDIRPYSEEFYRFTEEIEQTSSMTYEDLYVLDLKRQQRIKALDQLLVTTPKLQKFDLYLELAKLHRERHDFIRKVEISRYLYEIKQPAKKGQKEPVLSFAESQPELLKSADVLRNLMRDFPVHERAQEASFTLAQTLWRLGNENADYYYKVAFKKPPTNAMQVQKMILEADALFDRKSYSQALEIYKKGLAYKTEPVYPYVVYKLGWSYYLTSVQEKIEERRNMTKAVASFQLAATLLEGKKFGKNLRSEDIYDLCKLWSESDAADAENVRIYLNKIKMPTFYLTYLDQRANFLVENKRYESAVEVYRQLLAKTPPGDESLDYYARLIALFNELKKPLLVEHTVIDLAGTLKKKSPWQDAYEDNPALRQRAEVMTKEALVGYGATYQQKGEKEGSREELGIAETLYRTYLENFPNDEKAAEIRYNRALILFGFNEYEQAADEFGLVNTQATKTPKLQADAAYNQLYALYEADKKASYPVPTADPKRKGPPPIPPLKQKFINTTDAFVKSVAEAKRQELIGILYENAAFLMGYGYQADAVKRFEDIAIEYPKSQQGMEAIKVVINFYVEGKNIDGVIATCTKLLSSGKLKNTELEPVVVEILQGAQAEKESAAAQTPQPAAAGTPAAAAAAPTDKTPAPSSAGQTPK